MKLIYCIKLSSNYLIFVWWRGGREWWDSLSIIDFIWIDVEEKSQWEINLKLEMSSINLRVHFISRGCENIIRICWNEELFKFIRWAFSKLNSLNFICEKFSMKSDRKQKRKPSSLLSSLIGFTSLAYFV